ncbi:MAG TPA: hypothetical protein VFQ43_21115 [Nitrososphaera sp.]|nr:hypothetical protein [Nitrososphaera sp.]
MDSESVKLVEQAVADGLASEKWLMLLISLVAAGIGAFFGSYLNKLGEYRAATEHFDELLRQLKIQTKATEEIKGEIAAENTRRGKIDDTLFQYSKLQCSELLEVHRMLYESGEITETLDVADFVKKIKEADQRILKPLTDFRAFLDEPVRQLIYPVHNMLEQFKYNPSKDARRRSIP